MKHTILFLAANPLGTDQRALEREARAIQVELERSGFRDNFDLVTRWAAEPLDVLRELRKLKPTVVHFSGNGGPTGASARPAPARPHHLAIEESSAEHVPQHGTYFQGPDGRPQFVSTAALEEAFDAAGSSVKLVVLAACYSEAQAAALLTRVDCVVAMPGPIHEDAMRSFAIGFYGGLGERESIAAAYKQGCAAISLEGLADTERPQLKTRSGVDAARLILSSGPQAREPDGDVATAPRAGMSGTKPKVAQAVDLNRNFSDSKSAVKIFISYHRQVGEFHLAATLHEKLSTQGHTVLSDAGLKIGSSWAARIQQNIHESDLFVLLVTGESIAQEMVQAHVREAHLQYRKHGKPQILPVRVCYDGPLDYEIDYYLRGLEGAFWNGRDDDGVVLDHIERAIAGTLASTLQPSQRPNAQDVIPPTTLPEGRPTPAMDLRLLACPGGTMALSDPFYMRRQCDDEVEALARAEECQTLIIKGARQRGKSSLLVRYLAARSRSNKKIALIDFQTFSGVDLESYLDFLSSLAAAVVDVLKLHVPEPKIQRQGQMVGFLERTMLEVTEPIVLAFDEVDRTAGRSYGTDFWGMLRSWHNRRANPSSTTWRHLDLVLAISTEPDLLIKDDYQSPFNVGHTIEISSLNRDQCHELSLRYQPMRLQSSEVDEIYELVGGHPYLTRLAYHRALTGSLRFPLDMRTAADAYGPFGDHLRALLSKMSHRPALLAALRRIIRGHRAEADSIHRLRSAGLVHLDGGVPVPSNLLYTVFFRDIQ